MIPFFRDLDDKTRALIAMRVVDEAVRLSKTYSSDILQRTCWICGYIQAVIPEMGDIRDGIVARLTLDEMSDAAVDKD